MAINKSWLALIMVAVSILVLVSADPPPEDEDAIRCSGVWWEVEMCDDYVRRGAVAPSFQCCSGASLVYEFSIRQLTCSCLKSIYRRNDTTPAIITNLVVLPRRCGINVPYQITPNTDCSRI